METESVSDLYQASYYLLSGCEILNISCIPTGKFMSCQILMQGPDITKLAQTWFEKKAVANLWAFRNAYTRINSHVHMAKRSLEGKGQSAPRSAQ